MFPPKIKFDPLDNLNNKSICNLISVTMVTVGCLSIESIQMLAIAFPQLENIITTSNRYTFDIGRIAIEATLNKS